MSHANIALFVPHIGCPNQCSFCNQRSISGKQNEVTPEEVTVACKQAVDELGCRCKDAQVAFFGGSFTAIDREYMISLLEATRPFVKDGVISGIRISTRPDAINSEILDILESYKVTSIELGVQSMDDEILQVNQRGHTSEDVIKSSGLIKSYGIELGLQMMTGLYRDSPSSDWYTAYEIAKLKPETLRIYPTILIRGTLLENLYKEGLYKPEELENSINLCSELLEFFYKEKIRVIRLGLHASTFLEKDVLGGPYHPAFRELCESKIYLRNAVALLKGRPKGTYCLSVKPTAISKMVGQKKSNIQALKELGYFIILKPQDGLEEFQVTESDVNPAV